MYHALLLAALASAVFTGATGATFDEWNCLRDGDTCDAASTVSCQTSGDCDCSAGFTSRFDCGLADSLTSTCPGGTTCNGHSTTCVTAGGACVCPPTHYGDNCEFLTLEPICSVIDEITAVINLPGTGLDKAFVKGFLGVPACVAVANYAAIDATRAGDYVTVDTTDDTCGTITPDANSKICVTLVLQFLDPIFSSVDLESEFCCQPGLDIPVETKSYISTGNGIPTTTALVLPDGSEVTVSLYDSGTTTVMAGTVDIGHAFDMVFELIPSAAAAVADMAVVDCDAEDAGPASQTITFMTAKCPTQRALITGTDFATGPLKITLNMVAFKFQLTSDVFLKCRMNFCTQTFDANCDAATCTGYSRIHYGRRKREAVGSSNSTFSDTLKVNFSVNDPAANAKTQLKEAVNDAITKINMTGAVIGLGVLVLLLLCVVGACGFCLFKSRYPVSGIKA